MNALNLRSTLERFLSALKIGQSLVHFKYPFRECRFSCLHYKPSFKLYDNRQLYTFVSPLFHP
jgi:hypothetical protein